MSLEVTSSQNITRNIFVKRRLYTITGGFNDVFVAIATPEQIESLGVLAPTADTTFFLDSKITLLENTVEYLNAVLQEILQELQNLVIDVELIQNIEQSAIYTITSGNIQVNVYDNSTLYRLPLYALPCGIPVNTNNIITISNVNPILPGWLPTSFNDPAGYYFKYNIATDPNLPLIFPAAISKLSLAQIEKNGVIQNDGNVLINATGIYWRDNAFGLSPWPVDYVDPMNPGGFDESTEVVLVLDITV